MPVCEWWHEYNKYCDSILRLIHNWLVSNSLVIIGQFAGKINGHVKGVEL